MVNASQKLLLLGLNYDGFVSKERNLRGTMETAVLPEWKGIHLFLAIPRKMHTSPVKTELCWWLVRFTKHCRSSVS